MAEQAEIELPMKIQTKVLMRQLRGGEHKLFLWREGQRWIPSTHIGRLTTAHISSSRHPALASGFVGYVYVFTHTHKHTDTYINKNNKSLKIKKKE